MAVAEILAQPVFVEGANVPFGEMSLDQVRARAVELRAAVGWGPTARVAPVARAWAQLAIAMQDSQAAKVGALEAEALEGLAPQLWVILPGVGG